MQVHSYDLPLVLITKLRSKYGYFRIIILGLCSRTFFINDRIYCSLPAPHVYQTRSVIDKIHKEIFAL